MAKQRLQDYHNPGILRQIMGKMRKNTRNENLTVPACGEGKTAAFGSKTVSMRGIIHLGKS
jgi:hypothetical protein